MARRFPSAAGLFHTDIRFPPKVGRLRARTRCRGFQSYARPVIVAQAAPDYVVAMPAVLRFLMVLALMLMPMGMASAQAAFATGPVAMSDHCDEHQPPAHSPTKSNTHCATCSALPAVDAPVAVMELRPAMPRLVTAANAMSDPELETATPPPRIS